MAECEIPAACACTCAINANSPLTYHGQRDGRVLFASCDTCGGGPAPAFCACLGENKPANAPATVFYMGALKPADTDNSVSSALFALRLAFVCGGTVEECQEALEHAHAIAHAALAAEIQHYYEGQKMSDAPSVLYEYAPDHEMHASCTSV